MAQNPTTEATRLEALTRKNVDILQNGDGWDFKAHFAQYPVIFLNLNVSLFWYLRLYHYGIAGRSDECAERSLQAFSVTDHLVNISARMRTLFGHHQCIGSFKLIEGNPYFEDIINRYLKIRSKPPEHDDVVLSLFHLMEAVYAGTGKKVTVLIDEYDLPVYDAYAIGPECGVKVR